MIDIKILRSQKEAVIHGYRSRGMDLDWDHFFSLDQDYQRLSAEKQHLQTRRNALSAEIGKIRSQQGETLLLEQEVSIVNADLDMIDRTLSAVSQQWESFLESLPNLPSHLTPIGSGEEENVVLKEVGSIARSSGVDHSDLLAQAGLLLHSEAAALSGTRFSVLKGNVVKLQRALITYMLDFHEKHGRYEEYYVPYLVHPKALFGTGQLPKFEQDLFSVGQDKNHYLIPTAEVPLTNLVADKILKNEDLPLRMMAHTPCFRAEAGSYGRDMKGFFRQHQFEKIELVHIITHDQVQTEFDFLVQHVSNLLSSLELPHRLVALCTGDIGFASARTIDLEVWLPGQQKYREISSCSHFTDFQGRRMKARHRADAKSSTQYVHTLNGSGVAVGRALIALIENHADEKGCFIPQALRPYLNGTEYLLWTDKSDSSS